MKQLTVLLFLVLISCKSLKTEGKIDKSVYDMWDNYTSTYPEFKNNKIPESLFFHNNKEDANRLAELIVNKKKQAGSSLFWLYEKYDADLTKVGTKQIVTDFDGKARAIIEIKKVDTIPFNKISKSYAALDMGTEIDALKKWKKAHWEFFAGVLEENRERPTEDMLVVCEKFETVWTED